MKTSQTQKEAMTQIRNQLKAKRLDPRRLFIVEDGAYAWIGDRKDLTAKTARQLRAIDSVGRRPDQATASDRRIAANCDYDAICSSIACVSVTHGGVGSADWFALPADWQSGRALGPIAPL